MNKIVIKELEKIAQEELHIATFEERKMDNLDFYDCAIWCIKSALERAYNLGVKDTKEKYKNEREEN